jgi:cardiolipin synthase A/B
MKDSRGSEYAKKKKKGTPGTVRVVIVILALIAQLVFMAFFVDSLKQVSVYFYFLLELASGLAVIFLLTKNRNSSFTIVWLLIILLMPVFGYLLFLFWGTTGLTHRKSRIIRENIAYGRTFSKQDPNTYSDFQHQHSTRQRIETYLHNEGFPIYSKTQCSYYPLGELQFDKLIEDLEQARKYIFLEYYIIADGQLWERIHNILRHKSQQGVEIRILIDDFGSSMQLSDTFVSELRSEGIKALRFNPVHLNIFRLLINYRDHQKIAVIDGNIGYTGGTNIADEYVNITHDLGHWKDTAIRLEGEAVWGLTVTFLQMWDSESELKSDYLKYVPTNNIAGTGFYLPFADGPINNPNNPALEVYRQIITGAQQYVYITTPYLVIDNTMKDILCMAAKGGIDVRIVTPKIWDHWYVHMVTQSNYEDLLAVGVRIYEYTPGFIHAKTILSDDDNGIIGSINMDYRSFYFLFENGVWMVGAPVLKDIKLDMMAIFETSEEIEFEEWISRPLYKKVLQNILRIFAPLF